MGFEHPLYGRYLIQYYWITHEQYITVLNLKEFIANWKEKIIENKVRQSVWRDKMVY